jgi:hypothetical protein
MWSERNLDKHMADLNWVFKMFLKHCTALHCTSGNTQSPEGNLHGMSLG